MGAGYSDQNNFLELTFDDLPAMSVDGNVLDITEMVIPDGYTTEMLDDSNLPDVISQHFSQEIDQYPEFVKILQDHSRPLTGLGFLSQRILYAFWLILDLHMRPILRFVLGFRLKLDSHMGPAFLSRPSFRLRLDRVIRKLQINLRAVSIQI